MIHEEEKILLMIKGIQKVVSLKLQNIIWSIKNIIISPL